jgi:hypothetical protein
MEASMTNRVLAAALVLGALAPLSVWGEIPLGPEFQVNTYTQGAKIRPAVSADADGGFVVVWDSHAQDGDGLGVFARRYDSSGVPVGSAEFRVNAYTTGAQYLASVAASADRFVVVWIGDAQDGSGLGIFGRQFDALNGTAGSEFQVNTVTQDRQDLPAVAANAAGSFVVTWQSRGADGPDGGDGIVGRRYDASGAPQGPEFAVNTFTTAAQSRPGVAMDPSGNFVVAWDSAGQDGSNTGVIARLYTATGAPLGPEFQVNTYTTGYQIFPSVGMDGAGNFVVAWSSHGQDGSYWGLFGQRFDAAGTAVGGEFRVNSSTTDSQLYPSVTVEPGGRFVVGWTSAEGAGDFGVFGRKFDALGTPRGVEFRLNEQTTGSRAHAAVASSPDGNFVAVWHGTNEETAGVFGRRFSPLTDALFSDGFESGTLAAWSGNATDGGDLHASIFAALKSTGVGLRAVVDDTAGLYVEDATPGDERRYRARFYLDPNGFDPGESQAHRRTRTLLAFSEAPTRRVAAIVLRRLGGAYSVMGRARLDDNSQADTGFFAISDAPHAVEIDLVAASGPDALDGSLELWIDGVSVSLLTGLDNNVAAVDFVRMGALSVKTGATGTLYFDEFESRRQTYIGP